jgi:microcystin degradation protein MlrC
MQKGWMLALTPGGVDQNLERLPYKRIQRPMYPLDKNMSDPDLTAKMVH